MPLGQSPPDLRFSRSDSSFEGDTMSPPVVAGENGGDAPPTGDLIKQQSTMSLKEVKGEDILAGEG